MLATKETLLFSENPVYKNLPLEFTRTVNADNSESYTVYFKKDGKRANIISKGARRAYQIMAAHGDSIILKRRGKNGIASLLRISKKTGAKDEDIVFGAEEIAVSTNEDSVYISAFTDAKRISTPNYYCKIKNGKLEHVLNRPSFNIRIYKNTDNGDDVKKASENTTVAKKKGRATPPYEDMDLKRLRTRLCQLKYQIKKGTRTSPIPKELTDAIFKKEAAESLDTVDRKLNAPKVRYSDRTLTQLCQLLYCMRNAIKHGKRKSPIPDDLIAEIKKKKATAKAAKQEKAPVAKTAPAPTAAPAEITAEQVLEFVAKNPWIIKDILRDIADSIASEKPATEKKTRNSGGTKPAPVFTESDDEQELTELTTSSTAAQPIPEPESVNPIPIAKESIKAENPGPAPKAPTLGENDVPVKIIVKKQYLNGALVDISAKKVPLLQNIIYINAEVLLDGKVIDFHIQNQNNPQEHKVFFANGLQKKFTGQNKFSKTAVYITTVTQFENGLMIELSNNQKYITNMQEINKQAGARRFVIVENQVIASM
ncbi:MAG: hypothetical protein LBK26_03395 [Rickettsiales bacterium]|jgi:hypothetical protein|nr:hypothetical protein [Rickettsiales bacterium]